MRRGRNIGLRRSRNEDVSPPQNMPHGFPEATAGDGGISEGVAFDLSAEGAAFSALDLRDRVVIMLLFNGVVQIDQVAQAWERQRRLLNQGKNEALWRVLAAHPEVDREQVYAVAAEVYVFEKAKLSPSSVLGYLRSVKRSYTERQWEEMKRLNVLPVGQRDQLGYSERVGRVFATHDPAHPEVQRLMQGLKLGAFELCYAPESLLRSLLEKAFPGEAEDLKQREQPGDALDFDLGTAYEKVDYPSSQRTLEAKGSRHALVNLLEAALAEAARLGASDVHIHLNAEAVKVHFGIDGALQEWDEAGDVQPEAFKAVFEKA